MSERDVDELIARGREVVAAMTEGDWRQRLGADDWSSEVWDGTRPLVATLSNRDAEGIAWLRTNAPALLDAAQWGQEAERAHAHNHGCTECAAMFGSPVQQGRYGLCVDHREAAEARCVELQHQVETLQVERQAFVAAIDALDPECRRSLFKKFRAALDGIDQGDEK